MYKLKLLYIEDRGKTDLIRLILSYANQDYESVRIKTTEWSQYKPYMPFEQLPVLVVDDSLKISQPIVICRFLAKCFQLNGLNDFESIQCDMVVEQLREIIDLFTLQIIHEYDLNKKNKSLQQFMTDILPKTLNGFQKMLTMNHCKFIVGKQVTWADLALVNAWEWLDEIFRPVILNQYPMIKNHNEFIRSIKPVGDWFKTQKPLRVSKNV
jgi:glutathione S-transferase